MQGLTEEYVYKLKILIFGGKGSIFLDSGVGKSSLVYTYVNNHPPVSHFINEDLNFTRKKEEYLVANSIYECRLHLWEVANRVITNRAVQADLLKQVAAYIFIYKDEVQSYPI
jgi:GTPase SAR1 family protein